MNEWMNELYVKLKNFQCTDLAANNITQLPM